MLFSNSFELLLALKNLGYIKSERDKLWWPNSKTFEVVIGAILTQNTKWENVEKSLNNLRERNLLEFEQFLKVDEKKLAEFIVPSGFYNQKAIRLKNLAKNIKNEFGSFDFFCENIDREWLLSQKGLGKESADSILCYACLRDVFVVDSYTNRLLSAIGYEFEDYDDIQSWFMSGIEENFDDVCKIYDRDMSLNEVYARLHGKIVEYCKENSKGRVVDVRKLKKGLM
ncbi:MAG: 3-methyladenine DNA glycosylase [Campylobacterales bacterium]|nr:3-methyladenine DNA glycosylase [Campylobacterales bacterium]